MEHIQALTFGEFLTIGCFAYSIFLLSDILASFTIKFINKIKNKKGCADNEEKL